MSVTLDLSRASAPPAPAADAGIETPESQKRQILAALRAKLGACVAAPSTKGLDLNAQVTTPRAPGG